ncbi:hypothetical protein, partial [Pseudoalteromonas piscicida]
YQTLKEFIFSKLVHILAGPVLGLLAFYMSYKFDPLNFGQNPMSAVPAGVISIVIIIIAQSLSSSLELKKTSKYSDNIYEAIKGYLHVTKVGTPERAIEYINSRLSSLREVKNTNLNIEQSIERANERFYESDCYSKTINLIPLFCLKGLIWKDIGDRYSENKMKQTYLKSIEQKNNKFSNYKFRKIDHREPQMNFCILEYSDGEKEVLFNWDYRGVGVDPVVLISKDKLIVEMFCIHFEHLWNAGNFDHDMIATK